MKKTAGFIPLRDKSPPPAAAAASSGSLTGFSLIELLIVITVIGIVAGLILVGISRARLKGQDAAIRSSTAQLRIMAEQAFDIQGASYVNWHLNSAVQNQVGQLLADIDARYGNAVPDIYPTSYPGSYETVLRFSQRKDYCISAPLRSQSGFYCVDATGVFKLTSAHCPDQLFAGPLLRCP